MELRHSFYGQRRYIYPCPSRAGQRVFEETQRRLLPRSARAAPPRHQTTIRNRPSWHRNSRWLWATALDTFWCHISWAGACWHDLHKFNNTGRLVVAYLAVRSGFFQHALLYALVHSWRFYWGLPRERVVKHLIEHFVSSSFHIQQHKQVATARKRPGVEWCAQFWERCAAYGFIRLFCLQDS